MTPLEKQIIISHCLRDKIYFAKTYLKMKLTPEQEKFIRSLQEGTEQTFIRAKINESCALLKKNDTTNSVLSFSKLAPKNGAKIDVPKIIESQQTDKLKNL